MLGIAAIRYRNILSDRGGPVARIAECRTPVLGESFFHANVWLEAGLWPPAGHRGLFSDAAGSGTHRSRMIARHMAISEAMERWAYRASSKAEDTRFGFGADPTSNGMAAFPGLTCAAARRKARHEAQERLALLSWWEEHTACRRRPTPWAGIEAVELATAGAGAVVIVFGRTAYDRVAYGYGADDDFAGACRRAAIEMERHAQVLRRRCDQLAAGEAAALTSLFERRAWYFSTAAGHGEFLQAVAEGATRGGRPRAETVYDGPIPGPWNRYAQVWRVVYRLPSRRFITEGERYFFW